MSSEFIIGDPLADQEGYHRVARQQRRDHDLLLISRIAMMAEVTLPSCDLFARWVEITIIKDAMGNGSRSYDHLQVCRENAGPALAAPTSLR